MADEPINVTQTEHEIDPEDEVPARWGVRVLVSPDAAVVGKVVEVERELCIGRTEGPGVNLPITDPRLSRRHASIFRRERALELSDHDSKNGSHVDGVRARDGYLRPDSVLRFGGTILALVRLPDLPSGGPGVELLGDSAPLREVVGSLSRVAPEKIDVLLLGETGSGKELAARLLHRESGRSGELVSVNCGAIPEQLIESYLFGHRKGAFTGATSDQPGVFERAEAGTLFLDEVGELPVDLQPKLLRVLENREFTPVGSTRSVACDVRVVSATNVELEEATAGGGFRADLYARLAGYVVRLPPLRERRADIPLLVDHFVRTLAPDRELSCSALFYERLMLHDWPMNVRELRSVVQRVLVDTTGPELRADDLPSELGAKATQTPSAGRATVPSARELERALREAGGSVATLAVRYGKDRKQIYRWLEKHGLKPDDFRV